MAETRLKILMLIALLPALAIFQRLWSLQLDPVNHQEFKERAENARLIPIPPSRGTIYDRNGEILAESRAGFDLHFIYSELNPRHIVLEVVAEELARIGEFPGVTEIRKSLRQLVNIDQLNRLLLEGKTFQPQWLTLIEWIPEKAAKRISRRLSPRRFFRENFDLRMRRQVLASTAGQAAYDLRFRPEKVCQLELTLKRLASRIDRYSYDDLEARLDQTIDEIEGKVARYVRKDIEAGVDPLMVKKKTRNSRRLHYRRGELLARDIGLGAVSKIEYHPEIFPGIRIIDSSRRIYPRGAAFGPLTGYLRKLNPRDLARLDQQGKLLDSFPGIRSAEAFSVLRRDALMRTDSIGQGGLEEQYGSVLQGRYGMRLEQTGKKAGSNRLLTSLSSVKGTDLHTTIDAKLQELLYRQLWAECAHHGHAAGSVAVMDLPSGALRVSAGYPGYDPNRMRESAYHARMKRETAGRVPDWLLDRPRSKALYPGSIFKIITAIAALEDGHEWEGPVDPLRRYECRTGDDKPFKMRCASRFGHGDVNLYEAFESSCNNYFYYLSTRHLNPRKFDHWAKKLGCGMLTGLDLPRKGGLYDKGFLEKPTSVAGERGLCMYGIGQRQVQMTPLQALRAVGAVAMNLEKLPTPWIVKESPPSDLRTTNPRTAAIIQESMRRVVSDHKGTVYGKSGLEKFNFAAKTGTAQYRSDFVRYHSWLVGYGPLPRPTMAFVIVFEKSKLGGGDACSPVARVLLDYLSNENPGFFAANDSGPPAEDAQPPGTDGGDE